MKLLLSQFETHRLLELLHGVCAGRDCAGIGLRYVPELVQDKVNKVISPLSKRLMRVRAAEKGLG